jgi:hypothetical protein
LIFAATGSHSRRPGRRTDYFMEIASSQDSPYVKQFAVFLLNRAGALLSVVKLLEDASIHVLGLSLQDSVDVTVARLIVSDPDAVETISIERGIPFSTSDVLVVELKHGAEDLSRCLTAFLKAETNIHFAYPLLIQPGGFAAIALHLEDIELGESVIQSHQFRTLRQIDLSR